MSRLLLLPILLPLAALLWHGLVRGSRGTHARVDLIFQWVYGIFLSGLSLCALAGHSFELQGKAAMLGPVDIFVRPTLYLDGRNAVFLLLMGLCLPLIFSWLRDKEERYGASYYVSAHLLILSLAGVFLSDSLSLFYLFWETALIGAYFWIGLHGRSNVHTGSVYGALMRFCLFTLAGSLPMLLSIIALCAEAGRDPGVRGIAALISFLPEGERWWIFGGFALAFAVKLPLLGFHGWLRETYNVSAPACRALLSALMSKMGAYGFILVLAQGFPEECRRIAPQLQWLCVIGAVYGALLCLAQSRFVDILIYSSLSHLSLLGLGVFSALRVPGMESTGLTGALFQVFNHGLIMAALFAFDARISVSGDSPSFTAVGGLRGQQRRLAAVLLTALFASASLPGLSNFAGEILILFTAFRSSPWFTAFASLGALLTAAALIRAFHEIFLGKRPVSEGSGFAQAADLSPGETVLALALIALWLVLGLYPALFIQPVEKALLAFNAARAWTGSP